MSLVNHKKPENKVVKKDCKLLGYGGDNAVFVPKEKTAFGCYRTMKKFETIPGLDQWVEDAEFDTENEAWDAIKKKRVF